MMQPGSRWYAVQTHPNAERKARDHLNRQGYSTYLPHYLRRRRHARKTELVPAALFPRYLFVAIDMASQRWRSIQSTIGVCRLVCHGDEPAAVSEQVIAQLRAREDEGGFVRFDFRHRFAPGDQVRVIEGAFEATLGLFDRMSGDQRVAVLLDLLGRKVRVVLDAEMIAAA